MQRDGTLKKRGSRFGLRISIGKRLAITWRRDYGRGDDDTSFPARTWWFWWFADERGVKFEFSSNLLWVANKETHLTKKK